MSEKRPALSPQKERAAILLAEDDRTDEQIADEVGITARQLWRWKNEPAFACRIDEVRQSIAARVLRYAIARRERRVAALQDRWTRMQDVIDARSIDMADAAGGSSGLLVRQWKSIGAGPHAETVEEFKVDTGLLSELRAHEKQASQELGQWEEKVALSQTTRVVHEHRHRLEALSIDDLEALEAIGAKLTEARSSARRLPGDTIDAGEEEPEVVRPERLSEL